MNGLNVSKTYQRLLHAAKRIDSAGSVVHSAMLGLPQHIYSYRSQKTIDIGKETYRGFNKFVKTQVVVGEYADPTMKHEPVSEYVQRYYALHPEKEYDEDLLLEFDLLASIADKVNSVPDEMTVIEESEFDDIEFDSDSDFNLRLVDLLMSRDHSESSTNPILEHIHGRELDGDKWRGALMLQHPMSVSETNGRDAVPSLILGIDVALEWGPEQTVDEMADQRIFHGIMLNQPSTLDVSNIIKSTKTKTKNTKHSLKTSHGHLTVPQMFHECPVYIGGDSVENAEVLTTSKHCKGIPVMNGQLFMNPDLTMAKKMIDAGHADIDEFRFFLGRMSWDEELFRNVHHDRNMYSAFEVKKTASKTEMCNVVNAIWNNNEQKEPWSNTLQHAPSEWNSWIKIFEMMKEPHTSEEITALKALHRKTVAMQISKWQQSGDEAKKIPIE